MPTTLVDLFDGILDPTLRAELKTALGAASTADLAKLGQVTATYTEINKLHGTTATSTDLTKLHGVSATSTELNVLHGVTATSTDLNVIASTAATSTDLTKLHAVTASQTDLNVLASTAATSTDLTKLHGVSATSTTLNASVPIPLAAATAGWRLSAGSAAVTTTAEVATGLSAVSFSCVKLTDNPDITASYATVAASTTAGNILIKTWMTAGTNTTTPTAATKTNVAVNWIAVGT